MTEDGPEMRAGSAGGVNHQEKLCRRMDRVLFASIFIQFAALVAILVGLLARGSHPPRPWGVGVSIGGWSAFIGGFVLRCWVKRWFRRQR